jgi:WD40 repeat protein
LVGLVLVVIVIFALQPKDRLRRTWDDPKVPLTVSFSNSGLIAIGNQDGHGVELIDPNKATFTHKYACSFPHVRSIAFSKDGSLIAIGGGETFGNGGLAVSNVFSETVVTNVAVKGEVDEVDFSPDGQLLAFTGSKSLFDF